MRGCIKSSSIPLTFNLAGLCELHLFTISIPPSCVDLPVNSVVFIVVFTAHTVGVGGGAQEHSRPPAG